MRPLPDGLSEAQWAALIGRSHTMAVRGEILLAGQPVVDDVPIIGGTVTLDATNARYARLRCQIAAPDRLPATTEDRYAPSGYELRVSRGIQLRLTTAELAAFGDELLTYGAQFVAWDQQIAVVTVMIPLGVFPISAASIDVPGQVTTVSAWDRSWLIERAKFESFYDVASGTNYATAIGNLLADRRPTIETNFPTITFDTPHLVFDGYSDPWAAAQRMARSCGYALRFDGNGVATMVADATFNDDPVATLSTSVNAITATHSLDAEGAFNAQTVESANPAISGVYSATVVDDDPSSLTWWDGPFGHAPAPPRRSEYVASDEHCEAEARSILATTRGIASAINATAVTDPRWEPGDVIQVEIPELGIAQPHILESVTIGLSPADAMQLRTRTRRVVGVG